MSLDSPRLPSPVDPTAPAYKDWLHLNVFDHHSGAIGVFNVSLHGAPTDPRSRAIGTALLHVPGHGWLGNVQVAGLQEARIGLASIALDRIAVAVGAPDAVMVSASFEADGLALQARARPLAESVLVEDHVRFGSGWISWRMVPRMALEGAVSIAGQTSDLAESCAYHDHNWGRWFWGDDVGWEWGAFLAREPFTLVVNRATDAAHRTTNQTLLSIDAGGRRQCFLDAGVSLSYGGRFEAPVRRLPGALAALHQDRARPRLPALIHILADNGEDSCRLWFRVRAAAQIIAGDPALRGYGFIHELVGSFVAAGILAGHSFRTTGLGVFEHVD